MYKLYLFDRKITFFFFFINFRYSNLFLLINNIYKEEKTEKVYFITMQY